LEKLASDASPIARRAEQTVLLPVHKSVPSNKVRAFFQEGLEKSTEKGRRIDKMLYDRESISACFFVLALKSMRDELLSINFYFFLVQSHE